MLTALAIQTSQAAKVEEQSADRHFLQEMKRVVGDMRAARDQSEGSKRLEEEVARL